LIGRAYSGYCRRRIRSVESLSLLLLRLEEEVSLFLSTPSGFFQNYEDEHLSEIGFLDSVRSGESMADAFRRSAGRMALDKQTESRMALFFSDYGKSYREGELRRIEIFQKELDQVHKRETEEERGRVRLAYTLLFSAALGIIILLI
jgi:hypothetical protein